MTDIGVRRRRAPALSGRVVVAVIVAILAGGALAAIGRHAAMRTSSLTDVLLLGADLVPFVAVLVTVGFLVTAPGFTGFTAYLAIALTAYVFGAIGAITRADALMPSAGPVWNTLVIVSVFGFLPVAYLFPNGRFTPGWSRWLLLGWAAAAALALAYPWESFPPVPLAILTASGIALVLSAIGTQVWRYHRRSTGLERQQTKWLLLALALQATYFVVIMALPPNTALNLGSDAVTVGLGILRSLVTTGMVVAIAFAMLRYRLFDVDLVLGRTLVYGALTAFLLLCYLLIVGVVGTLWPAGTPVALPMLATALAVVGAEPLRRMLQRRVNRWLYGQRDEPLTVLTRLGDELSLTKDLGSTIDRITSTLAGALRFPRVRLDVFGGAGIVRTWTTGDPTAERNQAVIALPFEGRQVGRLIITPRTGERLSARDKELLDRIVPQAGIAIHAALVTEELGQARAAIIEAREQERRRLHRDLHDGLGPMLSSLHQRVDLADQLLDTDPSRAHALLDGTRAGLLASLSEVRSIVDALRPAILDRLGLVSAVAQAWASDQRFTVTGAQPPPLPAAVEAAAYRIAMEAIGNATRHAAAAQIRARFEVRDDSLIVEVVDDGCVGATTARVSGGLRTMRERAIDIGGTLVIAEGNPGTQVVARLPLGPVPR